MIMSLPSCRQVDSNPWKVYSFDPCCVRSGPPGTSDSVGTDLAVHSGPIEERRVRRERGVRRVRERGERGE